MSNETGAPPAESPPAETETETNVAQPATEVSTPAESSSADEPDAKSPDLLSVVKSAIEKPTEAAASSTVEGTGEGAEGEPKEEPEGKSKEDQEAADAKLPFHEHPRWKEVVAERNSAREEATSFRDDAGRFREIEGYMQTHGLTPQEVGEGFDIMAKLKSGTPEGLTEVREYFASRLVFLDEALGNVLPADLQEKVDAGLVDADVAKELAQTRAKAKIQTEQLDRRTTTDTEANDRKARDAAATAMVTAVDDFERTLKASDPDYARKAELVETTCRAIVQRTGKPPQNAEQAVQLVKDAYAQVNRQFKDLLPKPKAIVPTPQGSSAKTVTEPKSLQEAIANAVAEG